MDEEIIELQARVGALELLVTHLAGAAFVNWPELHNHVDGSSAFAKIVEAQTPVMSDTHRRYLQLIQQLIAKSSETMFLYQDVET